ncbi:hypothetical protein [Streptococcus equinus]|nr:hypothetical protein [Streptococcus equinus]
MLTYDPVDARKIYKESDGKLMISYNKELDKLKKCGYTIRKDGQFWRATK